MTDGTGATLFLCKRLVVVEQSDGTSDVTRHVGRGHRQFGIPIGGGLAMSTEKGTENGQLFKT